MTDTLALEKLYFDVIATFAAHSYVCEQPFGWRERAQLQLGERRIVWIPGDPSGSIGVIGSAKYPGEVYRSLGTLRENFHVVISAMPPDAAPENEFLSWKETRLLVDKWYNALYLSAYGTFVTTRLDWVTQRMERRYGVTAVITCVIESKLADEFGGDDIVVIEPGADTATGLGAARTVGELTELDHTETIVTGEAPYAVVTVLTAPVMLSGEQTLNGVALTEGLLVLVTGQASLIDNGPYIVHAGAWTRDGVTLAQGFFVRALLGDAYAETGWKLATSNPIVVGVSPLLFTFVGPTENI